MGGPRGTADVGERADGDPPAPPHKLLRTLSAGGSGGSALLLESATPRRAAESAPEAAEEHVAAATQIQTWFRAEQERRREKLRQRKLAVGEVYDRYRERREEDPPTPPQRAWAALTIERCYRGHRGRRRAAAQRGRVHAATRIQTAWRGHAARGELARRRSVWRCSRLLGCAFRCALARRKMHDRRTARSYASESGAKFMALLRGSQTRRMMRRWRWAVRLLCRVWRRYGEGVIERGTARREGVAAAKMQRVWRGHRGREQAKQRQRTVGRDFYLATKLQSAYRGSCSRRRLSEEVRAAEVIQRAWRVTAARTTVAERMRETRAATLVQRWFRCWRWRQRANLRFCACSHIQAVWRGLLCRRDRRREQAAALYIQQRWRGSVGRAVTKAVRRRLHDAAAVMCQAVWRGSLARIMVQQQFIAARTIQRFIRRQMHTLHVHSATKMQRVWKGHRARKTVRQYATHKEKQRRTRRQEASALLARWWHGVKVRLRLHRMHLAAHLIQQRERVRQARRWVAHERMRRNRAAALFQRAWRGWYCDGPHKGFVRGRGGRREVRQRRAAAIAVQRNYRGYLIRCAWTRKRTAATTIQTIWRFTRRQCQRRDRHARRTGAASKMQHCWRNFIGHRRRVEELARQNAAALQIQRQARGRAARNRAARCREERRQQLLHDEARMRRRERELAATAIQSQWRGHATRKWYGEFRRGVRPLAHEPLRFPTLEWYAPPRPAYEAAVAGDVSEQMLTHYGAEALERPGVGPIAFPTYDPALSPPRAGGGSRPTTAPSLAPPPPGAAAASPPARATESRSLAASLPAMGTAQFAASAVGAAPERRAQTPGGLNSTAGLSDTVVAGTSQQSGVLQHSGQHSALTQHSGQHGAVIQQVRDGGSARWNGLPVTGGGAAWASDEVSAPGEAAAAHERSVLSPAGALLLRQENRPQSMGEELVYSRDALAATIHEAHWQLMQVNHHLFVHQAERRRLEAVREHRRREQTSYSEQQRRRDEMRAAKAQAARSWGQAAERFVLEETMQRCRLKDEEESLRRRVAAAARDTSTASRPQQRKKRALGALVSPLDAAALEEHRVRQPQRYGYLRRLLEDDDQTPSPLSALDLTGQGLTDVTAYPVLRALETNTRLRELQLDHNKLGDGSCAALAASLRRNTTLQRVSLCFNPVTDAGARALLDALRATHARGAVTSVDLTDTLVSDPVRGELEQAVADAVVARIQRKGSGGKAQRGSDGAAAGRSTADVLPPTAAPAPADGVTRM